MRREKQKGCETPVEVRGRVCTCGEAASTQGYFLKRLHVHSGIPQILPVS